MKINGEDIQQSGETIDALLLVFRRFVVESSCSCNWGICARCELLATIDRKEPAKHYEVPSFLP